MTTQEQENTGESKQSHNEHILSNIQQTIRDECYRVLIEHNLIDKDNVTREKIRLPSYSTENNIEKREEDTVHSSMKVQASQPKQSVEVNNERLSVKPDTPEPQSEQNDRVKSKMSNVISNTLPPKFTQEFESYAEAIRENMYRKVEFLDENREINIPVIIMKGEKEFPCKLLLDTGAQRSFISEKFYTDNLQRYISKKQTFVRMYGVGGNELQTSGEVEIDLEIGTEIVRQRFIIAPLKEQGILGFDFCQNHKAEWRWQDKELKLMEETHNRHITTDYAVTRVTTRNKVEIPARSELIIAGIVEHASAAPDIGMIQPQNTFLENYPIGVAASITTRNQNSVPIRLINATHMSVHIEQNTPVALFEHADILSEINVRRACEQEGEEKFIHEFDDQLDELSQEEKERFQELLKTYKDQFMHSTKILGQTGLVKHKIHTGNHAPIKQRVRREPLTMQGVVKEELKKMEEKGVIEPSTSPWASPIVLCKKKDGTVRFCIDYRKLNTITEKDAYPLPRIEDNLDALKGACWFSTLDLASGYWQVQMEEESKERTAFCTKYGLYQFNVMPFGLCNAPGTFERLMETVLRGMQWERAVLYLDDIIIFSSSITEQMDRLAEVFERLKKANLTLKPSKCHFFQRRVEFLGHIVDQHGIHTDPKKIEAISTWSIPTRVKEVRAFLGLTGYYRRFIKDYGQIAKPLHQLTENNQHFHWTEETNQAFETLKSALTTAPILGYPSQNPEDQFILDTDASNCHIGAVLSQMQDGKEVVIAYGSKVLSKPERNYCVTRRELLSVVHFSIQFKHYLFGRKFKLRTDHGALVWLFQFKEPEGQLARWLQLLSQFDMDIVHRAGRIHGNGDGLSRRPCPPECPTCIKGEIRIQDARVVRKIQQAPRDKRGRTARHRRNQDQAHNTSSQITWLKEAQETDEALQEISTWTQRPEWVEVRNKSRDVKLYWSRWDQIEKAEGLWRFQWIKGDRTTWKWIVPSAERIKVITEYHSNKLAGHFSSRKTVNAIRRSPYYVPHLSQLAHKVCKQCEICERTKPVLRQPRAPMKSSQADRPMQRVAIDILGPLPESNDGNRFIIIIADYFTKWTEAYAVPNHQAATVAKCIVEQFFNRFGIAETIHTDQGRDFESKLFVEMCRLLEIDKTHTTPWHPQSDGMIERFNRTIETMLRQTVDEKQKNWDEYLPYCCAAYRSSVHSTTEFTPNELMLGRNLPLPNHLLVPTPDQWDNLKDYTRDMGEKQLYAIEQCKRHTHKNIRSYEQQYNKKSWQRELTAEKWVWLNNCNRKIGLSPKLQIQWEEHPYIIQKFLSEVVVKIKKWNSPKTRIVHVNKLKLASNQEKWNTPPIRGSSTGRASGARPLHVTRQGFPAYA